MSTNPLRLTICVIGRLGGWPGQPNWTDATQAYFVSPFVHDYGPPTGSISYTFPVSMALPSNPSNLPMYVTMIDSLHNGSPAIYIELSSTKFNSGAYVPLAILLPGVVVTDWNDVPSGGEVTSVFGRNGNVVAQAGDYSVAQVTGAAPLTGVGLPQDFAAFSSGTLTASQVVYRIAVSHAVSFTTNLVGSQGTAATASTGTATLSVQKNGMQFGTVVFTASATATFTGTATSFAAGDVLSIVAPSSPDATLAGVGITLSGTRA